MGTMFTRLKSEAMRNVKYKNMVETYNFVWLMNKLKLLCAAVDSHINKIQSTFHTIKKFYLIRKHSGKMVTKYFDRFKAARVNAELSKEDLTKKE